MMPSDVDGFGRTRAQDSAAAERGALRPPLFACAQAIKFLERGERVNKYVETEVLNHRMLRHPHVIEVR